jgi:hypothetical protein
MMQPKAPNIPNLNPWNPGTTIFTPNLAITSSATIATPGHRRSGLVDAVGRDGVALTLDDTLSARSLFLLLWEVARREEPWTHD